MNSFLSNFALFKALFLIGALLAFEQASSQICDSTRPRSTLIENFQLTSSGFVIQKYYDSYSKKIKKRYWSACSLGEIWTGLDCVGTKKTFNFKDAISAVTELRYAGFDDWKLPTIKQFRSIIEWQCQSPAVDQLLFPGIDFYSYWSQDVAKQDIAKGKENIIWVIDFNTGERMYANAVQKRYVVTVREEKTFVGKK